MKPIIFMTVLFTGCFVHCASWQDFSHMRLPRLSSSLDSSSRTSKPELKATHEQEFTLLKCTVTNPRPNVDVFISCPALGGTTVSGICYQGCQPTKPCPKFGDPHDPCVPNESTVFCEKMQLSNGTTSLTLRINRTDPRLAGTWSCAHSGLESTKFEISVQKDAQKEPVQAPGAVVSEAKGTNRVETATHYTQQTHAKELNQRSLVYLRRPEILFSVLAVLVVSLLINLAFCIRCMLMRSYIDASQEGGSQAHCLADCLCLPKEMRKTQAIPMTPILPRSTWGTQQNINGSYQGSAHLLYPSPTMQKMPMLIGQQSPNDISGVSYFPVGLTSGTLRRQQRMFATSSQLDGFNNSQMAYQSAGQETGDSFRSAMTQQNMFQAMNEMGGGVNYLPQYVRAPSVNTPSPNLSQRLASASMTNTGYQTQNMTEGTGGPQYFVRMPAPMIGGHVVYDDVAAGNSSLLNAYCRSPSGSVGDNSRTVLQLPAIYPMNPMKPQQSPQSSPLLRASTQPRLANEQAGTQQGTATSNADAGVFRPLPGPNGGLVTNFDNITGPQRNSRLGEDSPNPGNTTTNRVDTSQNKNLTAS